MRVISKKTLRDYWTRHTIVRGALEAWLEHVERACWTTPSDLQADYGANAVLNENRAVFNIKGNNYRLVVHIHYQSKIVFIRFIGTHAEYDRIDVLTV